MMHFRLPSLCWVAWIAGALAADNTNNQFDEPDGSLDDFTQTYAIGDTMNIKWRAGWWGSDSEPDNVDLFVCWFTSDSYSQLLMSNTTTKQANFFPWKINVTDDAVKADKKFVLRFRPHRDPSQYNNAGPMAPSRGFFLQLGTSSSSSSASVASSTAASSSTASSTPTSTPNKSSTPVGAIIGGIIGALAVIAMIVIVFLLLRISRKRKEQTAAAAAFERGPGPDHHHGQYTKVASTWSHDQKLAHTTEPPKYGSTEYAVELDATHRAVEAGGHYK